MRVKKLRYDKYSELLKIYLSVNLLHIYITSGRRHTQFGHNPLIRFRCSIYFEQFIGNGIMFPALIPASPLAANVTSYIKHKVRHTWIDTSAINEAASKPT